MQLLFFKNHNDVFNYKIPNLLITLLLTILTSLLLVGNKKKIFLNSLVPISFLHHDIYVFCHTKKMFLKHTCVNHMRMCN